jgi:hypothetical protein
VELLQPLVAYTRGGGVDARWIVIDGAPDFFTVTKGIHNRLKGRAVAASRIGGIQDQTVHGESGVPLDDPRDLGATPAIAQIPHQDNGLRVAISGRLEHPLDRLARAAGIRDADESRYSGRGHSLFRRPVAHAHNPELVAAVLSAAVRRSISVVMAKERRSEAGWLSRRRESRRQKQQQKVMRLSDQRREHAAAAERVTRGWDHGEGGGR